MKIGTKSYHFLKNAIEVGKGVFSPSFNVQGFSKRSLTKLVTDNIINLDKFETSSNGLTFYKLKKEFAKTVVKSARISRSDNFYHLLDLVTINSHLFSTSNLNPYKYVPNKPIIINNEKADFSLLSIIWGVPSDFRERQNTLIVSNYTKYFILKSDDMLTMLSDQLRCSRREVEQVVRLAHVPNGVGSKF